MDKKNLKKMFEYRLDNKTPSEISLLLKINKSTVNYHLKTHIKPILMGLYVELKISDYKGKITVFEPITETFEELSEKYDPPKEKKKKLPEKTRSYHVKMKGSPKLLEEFDTMLKEYLEKMSHFELINKSKLKSTWLKRW